MRALLHVPKSTFAYWWQVWLHAATDQVVLTFIIIVCMCFCMRMMRRGCMSLCTYWVLAFIVLVHAAKVEQVKFDTTQLHARPELAAEQRMVDDASGDIEVRELLWQLSLFPNLSAFSHTQQLYEL